MATGAGLPGQLADAYEEAWDTWQASGGANAWDAVAGDGLEP